MSIVQEAIDGNGARSNRVDQGHRTPPEAHIEDGPGDDGDLGHRLQLIARRGLVDAIERFEKARVLLQDAWDLHPGNDAIVGKTDGWKTWKQVYDRAESDAKQMEYELTGAIEHFGGEWHADAEHGYVFNPYGIEHRGITYLVRESMGNGIDEPGDLIVRLKPGRIADTDMMLD